jgi:hypothetical protein
MKVKKNKKYSYLYEDNYQAQKSFQDFSKKSVKLGLGDQRLVNSAKYLKTERPAYTSLGSITNLRSNNSPKYGIAFSTSFFERSLRPFSAFLKTEFNKKFGYLSTFLNDSLIKNIPRIVKYINDPNKTKDKTLRNFFKQLNDKELEFIIQCALDFYQTSNINNVTGPSVNYMVESEYVSYIEPNINSYHSYLTKECTVGEFGSIDFYNLTLKNINPEYKYSPLNPLFASLPKNSQYEILNNNNNIDYPTPSRIAGIYKNSGLSPVAKTWENGSYSSLYVSGNKYFFHCHNNNGNLLTITGATLNSHIPLTRKITETYKGSGVVYPYSFDNYQYKFKTPTKLYFNGSNLFKNGSDIKNGSRFVDLLTIKLRSGDSPSVLVYISPHSFSTNLCYYPELETGFFVSKAKIVQNNPTTGSLPTGAAIILKTGVLLGVSSFNNNFLDQNRLQISYPSTELLVNSGQLKSYRGPSVSFNLTNPVGILGKNGGGYQNIEVIKSNMFNYTFDKNIKQTIPLKDTDFYKIYSGLYNKNETERLATGTWDGVIPANVQCEIEILRTTSNLAGLYTKRQSGNYNYNNILIQNNGNNKVLNQLEDSYANSLDYNKILIFDAESFKLNDASYFVTGFGPFVQNKINTDSNALDMFNNQQLNKLLNIAELEFTNRLNGVNPKKSLSALTSSKDKVSHQKLFVRGNFGKDYYYFYEEASVLPTKLKAKSGGEGVDNISSKTNAGLNADSLVQQKQYKILRSRNII